MAIAKQRHDWSIAAAIQATQRNVMRAKGQPPINPTDLMPKPLRPKEKRRSISDWINSK
jgi:hypothetical protein